MNPQIDENIKLTIIIVDDGIDDHFFIKEALRGYKNIQFKDYFNGEDFLQFLEQQSSNPPSAKAFPEIVILDVNMPKMTGFEAFETIERRGLQGHLKFYVLTTSITPNEKNNCEKYKLRCYTKPFSVDNFTKLLEEIIIESC